MSTIAYDSAPHVTLLRMCHAWPLSTRKDLARPCEPYHGNAANEQTGQRFASRDGSMCPKRAWFANCWECKFVQPNKSSRPGSVAVCCKDSWDCAAMAA